MYKQLIFYVIMNYYCAFFFFFLTTNYYKLCYILYNLFLNVHNMTFNKMKK